VACCDVVNRGVAAWKGKLYLGAFDGRLIALDAKTGKEIWSQQTFDPSVPQSITGAPRVIKGKVIIGQGGAEYRGRGYVSAYDAETGKLAWRWYVVPGDPSKPYEQPELAEAAKTWKGDMYWKTGGGGTPWDGMAYDPELDTLYVGTGNGTPWNQSIRSPGGGDNLFLSSIVALDPNTGKYKWHYQTTPGESWDFTATQPIIVAELNYPTGKRKVVMEAPKNGFFYVLDAKDGKLISAANYGPVSWATHVDMKTGRPVEAPGARYDVTGKAVVIRPGALGMHNWYPMAFSPETGLVYIPVQVTNAPFSAVAAKDFKINPIGQGSNTGANFSTGQDVCQKPDAKCGPVESYILAWDPVNAKEVWRAKNEVYGSTGIMATAGNLIFSGNHKGEFSAYNATTGEKLWSAPTQARAIAAPSTFTVDGHQEIALLVGARGLPETAIRTNPLSANNSRLLVFKLGANGTLPKALPPGGVSARMKIDPPLLTAPTETVLAGEQAFAANCAACHGGNAVPGPGAVAPDLRYSGILPLPFTWNLTVRDGDRAARGMPAFGTALAKDTTDAILAYVIKRANDEKAIQEAAVKK
jgi:PQQ-dependent dehydrogenase (methanol/ethanol family)